MSSWKMRAIILTDNRETAKIKMIRKCQPPRPTARAPWRKKGKKIRARFSMRKKKTMRSPHQKLTLIFDYCKYFSRRLRF